MKTNCVVRESDPLPPLPDLYIGVDEVGRGPLAGPVVAAAVILNPDQPISGLADSKKISKQKREQLFDEIHANALAVGIGSAGVEEIDRINILQASLLAMQRAIDFLTLDQALDCFIDGIHSPALNCNVINVVKGDSRVPAISAASIVAKVVRDRTMTELHHQFPMYAWQDNSGYPTKKHLHALNEQGISIHHRRSFAPVKRLIQAV